MKFIDILGLVAGIHQRCFRKCYSSPKVKAVDISLLVYGVLMNSNALWV